MDLIDSGDGVGCYDEKVVFVFNIVFGDCLFVCLIRVKFKYVYGKMY